MLFLILEKVSLLPFHMCSCSPELVPPFAHYHLASRLHISAGFVSITVSLVQESPPLNRHGTTPMPLKSAYLMPAPPSLIMPHSGFWPSMLVEQPRSAFRTSILPVGPLQTLTSTSTTSYMKAISAKTTTARLKLTDDERRQMCIEAEQNPTMKQGQIGGMWFSSPGISPQLLTLHSEVQCREKVRRR